MNLDNLTFLPPIYRAIATNIGDWVYGSLVVNDMGTFIHTNDGEVYIAEPYTIGQYTGVEDIDGEPIYTGDVVYLKITHNPIADIAVVRFSKGYFILDDGISHISFPKSRCMTVISDVYTMSLDGLDEEDD